MNVAGRKRRPSPALLAMLVVLGLPALAQAQLIPNLTVKRQRPPCSVEDPLYRVYRQQFFGYYPTQWRRFPPGWNLMSPEAASPAELAAARAAIQKQIATIPRYDDNGKLIEPENGAAPGAPEEGDVNPDVPVPTPRVPAVPRGASPFDLEPKPSADPAPLPDPTPPPGASRRDSNPGLAATETPDLDLPLDDAAPSADAAGDDTPPPLPPIDGAISPGSTYAPRDDEMPSTPTHSIAPPTTAAPRRKTLVGGLFDTMRGRRRR